MFGSQRLFEQLENEGLGDWAATLRQRAEDAGHDNAHGHRDRWRLAIETLPVPSDVQGDFSLPAATFRGTLSDQQRADLKTKLMEMHPWRKGPFDLCGVRIDTEWRSNLKWDRLAGHIDFHGASVLDVGSGNGYYGWRMLGAGARRVIGLEPFPVYIAQHEAVQRFMPEAKNYVTPGTDADIPKRLAAFDIALSMGVLYHRTSPIDHLRSMHAALRPGGQLVMETLVIDQPDCSVLVPEGRYAQMRNVWFLPTPAMLKRFMSRCGFKEIKVLDVAVTTVNEQRSTDWMTFDSLAKFLSPDQAATIEGYPPPTRAIVVGRA